jgi:ATP-dependent RNA helicase DDX56/DBP9
MLLDKEAGTFSAFDFGLDRRLIKAVSRMGFIYPTLVQSKAIPLAMEGKDLLVRARTGSGKTAAFALPTLHKILLQKAEESTLGMSHSISTTPATRSSRKKPKAGAQSSPSGVLALILVPTKELCDQTYRTFVDLTYYCRDVVSVQALLGGGDAAAMSAQQALLRDQPDLLVATPSRLVSHLQAGNISLKASLQTLVMDEADLILSFGYEEDVKRVVAALPRIYQGILMSATLSPELDDLKRVVLHSPAVLKLEEGRTDGELLQFYVSLPEADKLLLVFVFLKLGVLEGKGLFFVNGLDACYRLKLFLEQFSIRSAVLNAELPLNSRLHTLQEFNRGIFDFLIATDESLDTACGPESEEEGEEEEGEEEEEEGEEEGVEKEEGGKGSMRKGKGGDEASAGRRGRRQSRGGGQAAGKEEGRPGEEEEEEDEKGECMMHGVSGSGLAGEVFVGEVDRERGRGRVGSPVGRATHV